MKSAATSTNVVILKRKFLSKAETWQDIDDCPFCQKETKQEHYTDGHERDSSHDKQTCLTCKGYRLGWGEWQQESQIETWEVDGGTTVP